MGYPVPVVGAVIFNPDNKILLCKSHKWNDERASGIRLRKTKVYRQENAKGEKKTRDPTRFGQGLFLSQLFLSQFYLYPSFALIISSRVGSPISCSSYRTRTAGLSILIRRRRSMGVPMTTASASARLIVSSSSWICFFP